MKLKLAGVHICFQLIICRNIQISTRWQESLCSCLSPRCPLPPLPLCTPHCRSLQVSQVQPLWQTIANEDRSRQAVDNPQAGRTVVNQTTELQLLDRYFNNNVYTAPHSVDMSLYATAIAFDASKAPEPAKQLTWFREQRKWIRVVTGCMQTGFIKKTGNGEMGSDGADADTRFWRYCRGDVLIMFMWLHWQRGHAIPAHCTAVLEGDNAMDVGVARTGSTLIVTLTV